jgi:hypothetical protein
MSLTSQQGLWRRRGGEGREDGPGFADRASPRAKFVIFARWTSSNRKWKIIEFGDSLQANGGRHGGRRRRAPN